MNKRLLREIRALYKQQSERLLLENDYIIHFEEDNMYKVYSLIKCPTDSVYKHKFIRLDFEIPEDYPHSPPVVTFQNHDSVRIHPNMYEDGKCCSTILNTWGDDKYEKWTSSMGIETVLLAFLSFFDNHPYTYEPGGHDDPSYTVYVRHQSWITCLIRYLQYEKIEKFKEMMHAYMLTNIDAIIDELSTLEAQYPRGTYFTRCFEIDYHIVNYERIKETLIDQYSYIDYVESVGHESAMLYGDFASKEWDCNICFDTCEDTQQIALGCGHKFHKTCVMRHMSTNNTLCPMCRAEVLPHVQKALDIQMWTVNPQTRRRIKIGGKTWQDLRDSGIL